MATMLSPPSAAELVALDNVLVTRLDVINPTSIEGSVKEVINQIGTIDALLNNAG